jgi:hypothetical protein
VKRASALIDDSFNSALRLRRTPCGIATQKPWTKDEQDRDSNSRKQHLEAETRRRREHVDLRHVPDWNFHERSCLVTDERHHDSCQVHKCHESGDVEHAGIPCPYTLGPSHGAGTDDAETPDHESNR